MGLFYLFKIFQTRYCFEPERETTDPFAFRCVPRPNDFADFADYHLRKVSSRPSLAARGSDISDFIYQSIIIAISHVRDERGNPFTQVQRFLVDLLTYNDNAPNSVGFAAPGKDAVNGAEPALVVLRCLLHYDCHSCLRQSFRFAEPTAKRFCHARLSRLSA